MLCCYRPLLAEILIHGVGLGSWSLIIFKAMFTSANTNFTIAKESFTSVDLFVTSTNANITSLITNFQVKVSSLQMKIIVYNGPFYKL